MVERMVVLDEGLGAALTLVEDDGGLQSSPVSVVECEPSDLRIRVRA